ncbi:hypothetical protein OKJ48_02515 [Streptomyces kunmingensis]|uniref:Uncharacterized protein n=1 Tax=Streptomyces kunmingensis TaxID=68225 RepID=A0ABU6C4K7_9ACTN|nr:hypothetical protein [Streptomyces kunmingensis]MEB3959136.1 hypothetical protein [Streptomyces kunmingensis]
MTAPLAETPQPRIQIVQLDVIAADQLAVVARCLGSTRLGAEFRCPDHDGETVDLIVTEIRRYPQVTVREVQPPHAARLILTGGHASRLRLRPRDVLRGKNPAA